MTRHWYSYAYGCVDFAPPNGWRIESQKILEQLTNSLIGDVPQKRFLASLFRFPREGLHDKADISEQLLDEFAYSKPLKEHDNSVPTSRNSFDFSKDIDQQSA